MGLLAAGLHPAIEVAVPVTVFGSGWRHGSGWYDMRICSTGAGAVGQVVPVAAGRWGPLEVVAAADTVIVAAGVHAPPDPRPELRRALQQAHARRARIVAVGAGVRTLASAELLAGRRAATHWAIADEMRRLHPDVMVEDRALYVEDGGIHTCAGAGATLDVCLELVRHDHGAGVANALAQWLVAPPQRAGDQSQLVSSPVGEDGNRLSLLLEWASQRLAQGLTPADLAQAAGISPRTLSRRFHAVLGTTPLRWLVTQRVRLAQELLESTDQPIDRIALRSGFGSASSMRQQFVREVGMSPLRYRKKFCSAGSRPSVVEER